MLGKGEVGDKKYEVRYLTLYILLLISILLFSCARQETRIAKPMSSDISSFKGLAYIVAEKSGVRWANNAAVIIKQPDTLRIDALERISDVVATLYSKGGEGYLDLSAEGKRYPLKNSQVILPGIGEIPLSVGELADILVGRPSIEGGKKEITDPFRSSFFIKSETEELEMSNSEKMPLVFTRYSSASKRSVLFEVSFDDFKTSRGKKFPNHIVLRFENPKLVMEIKYKEMNNEK